MYPNGPCLCTCPAVGQCSVFTIYIGVATAVRSGITLVERATTVAMVGGSTGVNVLGSTTVASGETTGVGGAGPKIISIAAESGTTGGGSGANATGGHSLCPLKTLQSAAS